MQLGAPAIDALLIIILSTNSEPEIHMLQEPEWATFTILAD